MRRCTCRHPFPRRDASERVHRPLGTGYKVETTEGVFRVRREPCPAEGRKACATVLRDAREVKAGGEAMPAEQSELRVRDVAVKLRRAGSRPKLLFLHGAGGCRNGCPSSTSWPS